MKKILIVLVLFCSTCQSYESFSGRTIKYWFAQGTPRKVKLATVVAARAWEAQTGIKFVRTPNWNESNFGIILDKQYSLKGTLACVGHFGMFQALWLRINANKKDGWKWVLGADDFGRYGQLCSLTSAIMHELGHAGLSLHDIDSGCTNLKDPLGSRDNWNCLYGRIWSGKLVLHSGDYAEIKRAEETGSSTLSTGIYAEEPLSPLFP